MEKNRLEILGEQLGWLAYMTVMGGGLAPIAELLAPRRFDDDGERHDPLAAFGVPLDLAPTPSAIYSKDEHAA